MTTTSLSDAVRADLHYAPTDSGWVSRRVDGPDDVAVVVELFRLSYERATGARARHGDAA